MEGNTLYFTKDVTVQVSASQFARQCVITMISVKGYYEVAEGYEVSSGCRIATKSNCYSGCIKTNPGNVGDLIQDQGYGEMFLGCYIRTIDASGKLLFSIEDIEVEMLPGQL